MFPEYRSLISKLKQSNAHFSKIFEEHNALDHEIIRLEKDPVTSNVDDIDLLKRHSVHDKFHRTLILSGFCFLKIAKISLNSSFFPKPIKR